MNYETQFVTMKKMLLILMVLASAAIAGDAEMKALLVGTWISDCTGKTSVFRADGKQIFDDGYVEKWDIKDGVLIEIPPAGERSYAYTILLLTKREFLARGESTHGRGYLFETRKEETPD